MQTVSDAEHWITSSSGSHLLIEGSGDGEYTIKGGAGGKLNGQKVSPKSMSENRINEKSSSFNSPDFKPSEGKSNFDATTAFDKLESSPFNGNLSAEDRNKIAKSEALYKKYGEAGEGSRGKFKEEARSGKLDHLLTEHNINEKAQEEIEKAAKKEKNDKWKRDHLPALHAAKQLRIEAERIEQDKKIEAERIEQDKKIEKVKEYYRSQTPEAKAARVYLNVPYAEKDFAKSLGAKWDVDKKKWYSPSVDTHEKLKKYSQESKPTNQSSITQPTGTPSGNRKMPTQGRITEDDPSLWGPELLGHEGESWAYFHASRSDSEFSQDCAYTQNQIDRMDYDAFADDGLVPKLASKDAAGIALMSNGKVLLLKRGDGGDYPGHWCFPGGHAEIGENAEQTALRETLEESGYAVIGSLKQIAYTANGDINFTTFGKNVQEFEPTLSDEHTEAGWFESGKYPEPLHPGCKLILDGPALDEIDIRNMNELDIARAMSEGYVSSPQRYMNVWLFSIRITGTGVAYRKSLEEFVFRNPEMYLNDDFLARCNGLQVIAEHPEKATLNNAEFQDRTIGSIFLPYIQGNEVWGIAKIYDAKAAEVMAKFQLSTSPTVVFKDPAANSTITLDDGAALLIEGKPSLLDHVAICIRGVWDKGGPPSGVSTNQLQGNEMSEAELKAKADAEAKEKEAAEAKAKADSEAAAKADAEEKRWTAVLDSLGNINKRMDSLEANMPAPTMSAADKAKKDSEEAEKKAKADAEEAEKKVAADKAKKDAEEKEAEEKAKADAEATRQRIADLEANLPKQMSDADYAQIADCQAKADSVYCAFGDSAPAPVRNENVVAYKKRLLHGLKSHSPAWKSVDIYKLDDAVVDIAEAQIYSDSVQAANHPTDIAAGTLRKIEKKDENGQLVRTFVGDPDSWMSAFKSPSMKQVGISKGNQ